MAMWTKLRPAARAFLRGVAELYELHVYTMGQRRYAAQMVVLPGGAHSHLLFTPPFTPSVHRYATQMVSLLDPEGELGLAGADRVIAKEDSTATHVKDLDVVLGPEQMALIVDDSADVWPVT